MYHLDTCSIPCFLTLTQAHKIFLTGKSINFIRLCCQESDWLLATKGEVGPGSHGLNTAFLSKLVDQSLDDVAPTAGPAVPGGGVGAGAGAGTTLQPFYPHHGGFNTTTATAVDTFPFLGTLTNFVNQAAELTNRCLVQLLLEKYQLLGHCTAIKRYLLLAQGDLVEVFLDLVNVELRKDLSTQEVFRHRIRGLLDQAIRMSNAQYHPPEFLDRLDVTVSGAAETNGVNGRRAEADIVMGTTTASIG